VRVRNDAMKGAKSMGVMLRYEKKEEKEEQ
jgi:hypothetical protein